MTISLFFIVLHYIVFCCTWPIEQTNKQTGAAVSRLTLPMTAPLNFIVLHYTICDLSLTVLHYIEKYGQCQLHRIVLYSTELHYTICTVQYWTALHYMYCTVLNCTTLYVLYSTELHYTVCTVQYWATLQCMYCTILHCTTLYVLYSRALN